MLPVCINTYYYHQNSNLGAKLLWTNPNITSSFAPQDIQLDLTNYESIIVEFTPHTTINTVYSRLFVNRDDVGCGGGCSLSGFEACVRGVKIIDDTKIHVYDCVNGSTIVNMYMIPYKIYGAKNII